MGDLIDDDKDATKEKGQDNIDGKSAPKKDGIFQRRDIVNGIIAGLIVAMILYLPSLVPSMYTPIDPTELIRKNLTDSAFKAESEIENGYLYPAIQLCKCSIDLYDSSRNNVNKSDLKKEYSKILSVMGMAYYELSRCEDRQFNLNESLKWYNEACNYSYGVESLSNLGTIYLEFSKSKDKKDNLERSLQFLNKSLEIIKDNTSLIYANVLIKRGVTYYHLSEVQYKRKYLMDSIKDYETALKIFINSTQSDNGNYADYNIGIIRSQLGASYRRLAEVEYQKDNLVKSIENNTLALKILEINKTHINDLSLAKRNQCNLNISLSQVDNPLTQADEPEYFLNSAIDKLNAILLTMEDCDFDHSEIENDLALAYLLRSEIYPSWSNERLSDIRNSTDIYNKSLNIWGEKDYPLYYEDILNDQGIAFYYRSRIDANEKDVDLALNNFKKALAIQNASKLELDFAETKRNEGKAYRGLANIKNREINLKNAITSYENAIRIWQTDPCPLDCAYTENLIGNAYLEISKIRDKEENLQYAIDAYRKALDIFNEEEYPEMNEIVEKNKKIAENPMW